LRGNSQPGLVPVKDKNKITMQNHDRVTGKDIGKNGKVCDTLDVKKNLPCEEKLELNLKKLLRLQMLIVI